MKTYNQVELMKLIADNFDGYEPIQNVVTRWLDRGDGAAIYINEDLGHPDVGDMRIISFGSDESQLPGDTPPQMCPDIGNTIGWRYQLRGMCRPKSPSAARSGAPS